LVETSLRAVSLDRVWSSVTFGVVSTVDALVIDTYFMGFFLGQPPRTSPSFG